MEYEDGRAMEFRAKGAMKSRRAFFWVAVAAVGATAGAMVRGRDLRGLVILDSTRPEAGWGRDMVIPALDHFGVPVRVLDVACEPVQTTDFEVPLVVVAHAGVAEGDRSMRRRIEKAVRRALKAGAGCVTMDPAFLSKRKAADSTTAVSLVFRDPGHFIMAPKPVGDTLRLFAPLRIPMRNAKRAVVLIEAGGAPFLSVETRGKGRLAVWAGSEWMHTEKLGPMAGLDGCWFRSLVWAARKPFVARNLPPLVTMRVDDVAGRGELWGKTPLYWVETASRYGFRPWLGLFIHNLTPAAVDELRAYIIEGKATAAPHAFGRPNRDPVGKTMQSHAGASGHSPDGYFYDPGTMPLRSKTYDEFIYFDHENRRPWPDDEAARGLEAVDAWYAAREPLPKSRYFISHWYEMGGNVIRHVSDQWGMEFIAQNKAIDMPWDDAVPWIRGGPFRLFEEPGTSTMNPESRGGNPVYYADFTTVADRRFFNCYTEIRDDAGYEWAPDNDVEATVGRGIRQLRRAIDAGAMAVLFTHETDYIHHIRPELWEEEIRRIAEGIADLDPVFLTSDEALPIVRAYRTTRIDTVETDADRRILRVALSGNADVETGIHRYTEEAGRIRIQRIPVGAFKERTVVPVPFD
jgi:hypothetical protein